jgi:hypothetical protein
MTTTELGSGFEKLASEKLGLALHNAKGWDGLSRAGRRIEIRARTQGSDGALPRLTVNSAKMTHSHAILAGHHTPAGEFVGALLVPTHELRPLYERFKQHRTGQAHIGWQHILSECPSAKRLSEAVTALLKR